MSTVPETLDEVYHDLLARAPENKMEPRMEPMHRMMELLGEPQRSAPVIHLTGTNGKTSTARMIESVLRAYGLSTGRYTSPHLETVTERISIDGEPVDEDTFVRIWNEILPLVEVVDKELQDHGENRLTYFEAVTVLAFAIFADAPVDVLVLEVGLGGITDATNVADGQVSVITPISLDHTDLLGPAEADIAREKAGIIKSGGFLVSAAQVPEAAQVLLEAAQAQKASYRFENIEYGVRDRSVAVGGQQVTVAGLAAEYEDLLLPLHGPHQAENLAVAIAALEAFLGGAETPLNRELLQEGIAAVTTPGRMEVLRSKPTLIVDAAHNPAGIEVTARTVQEAFNFSRLVLVVGVLGDKDALGILEALYDHFGDDVDHLCLTQSDSQRALSASQLTETALDAGWDEDILYTAENVQDALRWSVEQATDVDPDAPGTGGGILATGSITLVGEIRALLGPGPDPLGSGVVVDGPDLDLLDALDDDIDELHDDEGQHS